MVKFYRKEIKNGQIELKREQKWFILIKEIKTQTNLRLMIQFRGYNPNRRYIAIQIWTGWNLNHQQFDSGTLIA